MSLNPNASLGTVFSVQRSTALKAQHSIFATVAGRHPLWTYLLWTMTVKQPNQSKTNLADRNYLTFSLHKYETDSTKMRLYWLHGTLLCFTNYWFQFICYAIVIRLLKDVNLTCKYLVNIYKIKKMPQISVCTSKQNLDSLGRSLVRPTAPIPDPVSLCILLYSNEVSLLLGGKK